MTEEPSHPKVAIAVSLLLKGLSLDTVSKLLGHSSIKVTERHCAPCVKAGRSAKGLSPAVPPRRSLPKIVQDFRDQIVNGCQLSDSAGASAAESSALRYATSAAS